MVERVLGFLHLIVFSTLRSDWLVIGDAVYPILRCILLFFHPTWAVPREGLYLIKTARQTKIDAALQTSNTYHERESF